MLDTRPTFGGFIAWLTRPFFKAWWAVITGFASLLALYIARDSRITIGGAGIATMILLLFTIAFVVLSVAAQGWKLYAGQGTALHVVSFEKSRDVQQGWLLLIDGSTDLDTGAVIDVHKRTAAGEVPLALFEIVGTNSRGQRQATPIGRINPTHIREHSAGGLRSTDLVVKTSIEMRRMREVARDIV